MIYFISDLHLCHNKEFVYKERGFNNVYDMNSAIIKNWNSVVNSEDDVYLLGDIMLNDNEEGLRCLKQLKGNIHIIRGNHDTDVRVELYKECYNVVEVCDAKYLHTGKYHFFLSHYPCLVGNYNGKKTISICGHLHTSDPINQIDISDIYHVECDSNNCTPVSIDVIIEYFSKRG